MNSYDIGDKIRCQGTFQDSDSVNTNPTATVFKFKTPGGTTTTYTYGTDAELVRSATGIYYADITIAEEGIYHYRLEGTGTVTAGGEDSFRSILSQFY